MWAKGFLLIAVAYFSAALLVAFFGRPPEILAWGVAAALAGTMSRIDYYRKRRFGESGWPFLPDFFGTVFGVLVAVALGLAAYVGAQLMQSPNVGFTP